MVIWYRNHAMLRLLAHAPQLSRKNFSFAVQKTEQSKQTDQDSSLGVRSTGRLVEQITWRGQVSSPFATDPIVPEHNSCIGIPCSKGPVNYLPAYEPWSTLLRVQG